MYSKLIIIGSSSPTIIRIIEDINKVEKKKIKILGFIDNNIKLKNSEVLSHRILGPSKIINNFSNKIKLINTIAKSIDEKVKTTKYFENKGFRFTNIIHPSVNLKYVKLSPIGIYIQENALIQPNTEIEKHVIISSNSTIAHDSKIGEYTFVGPATYICGRVNVGKRCFIGVGTKIIPRVKVGNNVTIAAGSLVTKDIPSDSKVMGIPARIVN